MVTPSETTLEAPTGLRAEEADPTADGVKVYEPTGRSDQLRLSWDDVSGDLPRLRRPVQRGPQLRRVDLPHDRLHAQRRRRGAVRRQDRGHGVGPVLRLLGRVPVQLPGAGQTADGSIGPNSNLVRNVYPDRFGTEGDDSVATAAEGASTVCYGGLGGDDNIVGTTTGFTDPTNVIHGGDGNDSITGGTGDDKLFGGPGDDHVIGHQGNDFLNGEDGDDTLEGREGNDTLVGDAGNDKLYGGAGNDDLRGYEGDDTLDGGPGTNKLFGGAGHNTYIGGEGADEFDSSGGIGTADYSKSPAAVNVRTDGAYGNWPTGGHATGDRLIGVENVIGSDHDDVLQGYTHPNHFQGRKGNDTITGGRGGDTLEGERLATTRSPAWAATTGCTAGTAMTCSRAGPATTGCTAALATIPWRAAPAMTR